jgi:hypothetical protein
LWSRVLIQVINLVTLISQCIPPIKLDDGWICRHQMGPSVMFHTFLNGFVLWCYVMPPICTLIAPSLWLKSHDDELHIPFQKHLVTLICGASNYIKSGQNFCLQKKSQSFLILISKNFSLFQCWIKILVLF